mgnify:CR=1 FL=1
MLILGKNDLKNLFYQIIKVKLKHERRNMD